MSHSTFQADFLRRGGPMQGILAQKYDKGELSPDYVYREYPKMVYLDRGVKTIRRTVERIVGRDVLTEQVDEEVPDIEGVLVQSEEEEERVLSGGQTAAQVEEHRQGLLAKARNSGIPADPTWGIVRLQRELGSAPTSEAVEALRAKVADLEEKAELRRRIAELEAQISGKPSDEAADLRGQLQALGIEADGRWGIAKLRSELERATAPRE